MQMPYGLFSIRFFLAYNEAYNRLHREINFSQRQPYPAIIWAAIQLSLALNWRWRFARRETERAIDQFGQVVYSQEGISLSEHRKIVLRLSRKYCIHPYNIYRYRLYRRSHSPLEYIFPREFIPLHRMRNATTTREDFEAMQDKLELVKRTKALNLPTVPILQVLEKQQGHRSLDVDFAGLDSVFLKNRSGYKGTGAFALHQAEGSLIGRLLDGGALLQSRTEIDFALSRLLQNDDVLVQPFLKNHSMFAEVAAENEAVVMRIVTMRRNGEIGFYSAFLRIPVSMRSDKTTDKPSKSLEVLAGVDADSGQIFRNADSSLRLQPHLGALEDRVFASIQENTIVPFWDEIKDYSRVGHDEFSSLWAIGWDWVVTDMKAYLLEGNIHWDALKPQEVSGGVLRKILETA